MKTLIKKIIRWYCRIRRHQERGETVYLGKRQQ
jgi:hypothetical protein